MIFANIVAVATILIQYFVADQIVMWLIKNDLELINGKVDLCDNWLKGKSCLNWIVVKLYD